MTAAEKSKATRERKAEEQRQRLEVRRGFECVRNCAILEGIRDDENNPPEIRMEAIRLMREIRGW